MHKGTFMRTRRKLGSAIAIAAASALVFAGSATAEPVAAPVNPVTAAEQLLSVAEGNPDAQAALERVLADPNAAVPRTDVAEGPRVPAQIFPIPAYSDTGAGNPVTGQVHGSGIATNLNSEFRFGFFGGPGEIAPNQGAAKLNVLWVNAATGKSGTNVLDVRDIAGPTVISTKPIPEAKGGMVVAGIYGSILHRWWDPAALDGKGDWHYQTSNIWFPSLGAVLA